MSEAKMKEEEGTHLGFLFKTMEKKATRQADRA